MEKVEFGFAGSVRKDCLNKTNCVYAPHQTKNVTLSRQNCMICTQLQKLVKLLEEKK